MISVIKRVSYFESLFIINLAFNHFFRKCGLDGFRADLKIMIYELLQSVYAKEYGRFYGAEKNFKKRKDDRFDFFSEELKTILIKRWFIGTNHNVKRKRGKNASEYILLLIILKIDLGDSGSR